MGELGLDIGPPRWWWRTQRFEGKHLVRRIGAPKRNVELDSQLAVGNRENETSFVEARTGERRHGATRRHASVLAEGIDCRCQLALAAIDECRCDGWREHIGNTRGAARAKIDHTATRRVPGLATTDSHVDVIIE